MYLVTLRRCAYTGGRDEWIEFRRSNDMHGFTLFLNHEVKIRYCSVCLLQINFGCYASLVGIRAGTCPLCRSQLGSLSIRLWSAPWSRVARPSPSSDTSGDKGLHKLQVLPTGNVNQGVRPLLNSKPTVQPNYVISTPEVYWSNLI